MINEIGALLNKYHDWLKEQTQTRAMEDWVEITTPYLDRHNDMLQIYAKRENGHLLLTDDGYIISDLIQSGCSLDTPKRKSLLKETLAGFGISEHDGVLEVRATEGNFPNKKHNLLQAMLAVNDLFYLAQSTVSSLFYEDVMAWLDLNRIRYTENVKFTGKSGFDHTFHFVIPKSETKPERLLQAINSPGKNSVELLAFAWIDIKEIRRPDSTAYAVLNDTDREVAGEVAAALNQYGIKPISWNMRADSIGELAA